MIGEQLLGSSEYGAVNREQRLGSNDWGGMIERQELGSSDWVETGERRSGAVTADESLGSRRNEYWQVLDNDNVSQRTRDRSFQQQFFLPRANNLGFVKPSQAFSHRSFRCKIIILGGLLLLGKA